MLTMAEYRGKVATVNLTGGVGYVPREAQYVHVTGTGGTLILPGIYQGPSGRELTVINRSSGDVNVGKPTLGGAPVALLVLPTNKVGKFYLASPSMTSDNWTYRNRFLNIGTKKTKRGSGDLVLASSLPSYDPECKAWFKLTPCIGGEDLFTTYDLRSYIGDIIQTPDLGCYFVTLWQGNDPTVNTTIRTPILTYDDCDQCSQCEPYEWICEDCCINAETSSLQVSMVKQSAVILDGCGENAFLGFNTRSVSGVAPFCVDGSTSSFRQFGENTFSGFADCYREGNECQITDSPYDAPSESHRGYIEAGYLGCNAPEIIEIYGSSESTSGSLTLNFDGTSIPAIEYNDGHHAIWVKLMSSGYFSQVYVDGAATLGQATSADRLEIHVFSPSGNLPLPTITSNSLSAGTPSINEQQAGNDSILPSWSLSINSPDVIGDSWNYTSTDSVGGFANTCAYRGTGCGSLSYRYDSIDVSCSGITAVASQDVCDGQAVAMATLSMIVRA